MIRNSARFGLPVDAVEYVIDGSDLGKGPMMRGNGTARMIAKLLHATAQMTVNHGDMRVISHGRCSSL